MRPVTRGRKVPTRFELLSCAFAGHVLVGTDATDLTGADPLLVRRYDGVRWHRCLRCDGWFPVPPPTGAATDGEAAVPVPVPVPGRQEIEVPLRGRQLRDRYVLRLIALDRAVHVLVLVLAGLAILLFLGHRKALIHDYWRIVNDLSGGSGGPSKKGGIFADIHRFLVINPSHLYDVALVAFAYAALEATEMVGLWFAKRWAEYLTFVATIVFIPFEIYELSHSVTVLKVLTFVINVAIAAYLLAAKRLFGLRGGHRALLELRARESGWAALEQATADTLGPPAPVAP